MLNKILIGLFLAILLMIPGLSKAKDSEHLARIMYGESRGESVEGVVGIGEAAVNRSRRSGVPLHRLMGVHKVKPPKSLLSHYTSLANSVLSSKKFTVKDADSWNKGKKPHLPGKITRQIGAHVFYVMAKL
jgi:spore germination cell wall hydrolase CwlJ-like protein